MLNKTMILLWLKKKKTRRIRLIMACLLVLVMTFLLLFIGSGLFPRYILTLENRLSLMTPAGFKMNNMFIFQSTQNGNTIIPTHTDQVIVLQRPDQKEILFIYPNVVRLGEPLYLSDEITQSVDFTLEKPPANGLIQIWTLTGSADDFLNVSLEYTQTEYLTFKSTQLEINQLRCIQWDYTFSSNGKIIHGLEAFFDDKPYLYRVSIFFDENDYDEQAKIIFDNLIQSVHVK